MNIKLKYLHQWSIFKFKKEHIMKTLYIPLQITGIMPTIKNIARYNNI